MIKGDDMINLNHYTRRNSMEKKTGLLLIVLLVLFAGSLSAQAQTTYYVRSGATGSNNGSDWTNAYSTLPATLVRGATYYLSSGNYGSYTFDDAAAGTTVITIKKATASAHGTNTGWNDAYGVGQAIFTHWEVYTDYWVFDGQTRNSDWKTGGTNAYGIKVSGRGPVRLDNGAGTGADNVTFRYIDFVAGGQHSGYGDDVIYGLTGNQNITFQYCALHDSDRTIWLQRGCWQNMLVEYCYIARNTSTSLVHGEMLSDTCSDNQIFRYNIIQDIMGTGVWAVLNGTGSKSASNTASGWKIYGNVIHWRPGNGEMVSALFYSANDGSNTNWTENLLFYNNTIAAYDNGQQYYGLYIEAGGGLGNIAKNNIWYNTLQSAHSGVTLSYNWYYSTTHSNDSAGTTQDCSSGCTGLFVNMDAFDFRLSSTSLPNVGDSSIGAEYSIDMNGVTRGADGAWDRGAFEYAGNANSSLLPPAGVKIIY
jgi:hypothetical protein